jgi:hypothetical protein
MARIRGSVWQNSQKKKGYSSSTGAYAFRSSGDRYFVLTSVRSGKTRVYESPRAAMTDGWFIVKPGG